MARGKAQGRYTPDRKGQSGDDSSTRWLGTYGDAVTLLMAFFVMLYAMSQIDVEKFQAFVSGLEGPFGNSGSQESLLPSGASIVGDAGLAESDPAPAPSIEPVVPPPAPVGGEPAQPDLVQLAEVKAAVAAELERTGLEELTEFRQDERGFIVSIASDDVLFATGSTAISPVGQQVIASVARALMAFPNQILVEGHSDNVPLTTPGYTNWNLSTDRAVAVLSVLVERFDLPQDRLGAVGYSEYRPLAPNDTAAQRARNRRVDVVIVAEEAPRG